MNDVKNYKYEACVIERPWEEGFCQKCTRCFQDDMCNAYRLGMSHVYCPQLRDCTKFHERKRKIKESSNEDLRND